MSHSYACQVARKGSGFYQYNSIKRVDLRYSPVTGVFILHLMFGVMKGVPPGAGVVDTPRHQTPRLLINNDLVGSFGARWVGILNKKC